MLPRAMRSALKKILTLGLVLSLSFFPAFSISGPIYASNEVTLQYQTGGVAIPAVPVTDNPPPVQASVAGPSTSESPLSPAEDEVVTIESNDPFYNSSGSWGQSYEDLWWLKRVDADDAWAITRGTGVPVAVIDTGVDFNHPDLAANIWTNPTEANGLAGVDDDGNGYIDDIHGWDLQNNDNDPQDDNGHGTHVSGIIGAVADNSRGIAGVAPESKIIPVKVLDSGGSGLVSKVISGIRYAADLGAKVINMSLGIMRAFLPKSLQTALVNAVKYALGKGSVVVAAAGNENSNVNNEYPAGIHDVIAVGATDPNNKRAWFSNFGSELDLVAPGVDVLSLRAGGTNFGSNSGDPDYSRASGTSMASPIVAGTVALIRAKYPALSFNAIYDRLRYSAVDLGTRGFDKYYGYGLVNAYKALTYSSGSGSGSSLSGKGSSSGSGSGGSSSGKWHKAFEGGIELPNLNPGPGSSIGNWYSIAPLSSAFRPDLSKKKKTVGFFTAADSQ